MRPVSRGLPVLLAAFLASVVHAQTATIDACVGRSGVVRVIEAGGACRKKERPISWSAAGPAGPPGAQGPEGPQGPAGPAAPETPACTARARLTISTVAGPGPGGTMDAYAFSFSVQYNPPVGAGTGTVSYGPLIVTKALDTTSETLFSAAIEGLFFEDAKLEVLDAAGTSVIFTYELEQVRVLSVTQGSGGACDAPAVESIALDFQTITLDRP